MTTIQTYRDNDRLWKTISDYDSLAVTTTKEIYRDNDRLKETMSDYEAPLILLETQDPVSYNSAFASWCQQPNRDPTFGLI